MKRRRTRQSRLTRTEQLAMLRAALSGLLAGVARAILAWFLQQ